MVLESVMLENTDRSATYQRCFELVHRLIQVVECGFLWGITLLCDVVFTIETRGLQRDLIMRFVLVICRAEYTLELYSSFLNLGDAVLPLK